MLPFLGSLKPCSLNYHTLIYGTLHFKIPLEILTHILRLCGSMCFNQELIKRFVMGIKGACFVPSGSLFKGTEAQNSIDVQVLNDEA